MTPTAPDNPDSPEETESANDIGGPTSSLAGDFARAGVSTGSSPTDAAGLAKFAGKSILRAMGAFTKGSIDTANEIAHDISTGEPITGIIDTRVEQVRSAAWNALGIDGRGEPGSPRHGASYSDLRTQGNSLIDNSWDVSKQPREQHPSFKQILDALVPDEARILRFLAVAGPQPAIDIRTKTPFGVGSERIAGGINMIADMAGCAWPDRDQHYLANLNRLGLVRFSEEPVEDYRRYSLLSAHPAAMKAAEENKKTVEVYRSIYLSLFGRQFSEACFSLEGYHAGGWDKSVVTDKIVGKGPPHLRENKKKSGH